MFNKSKDGVAILLPYPLLLIIDNYDSFTYNLLDYFARLGQTCRVVRNNAITIAGIEDLNPDGIVISPGPETPDKAGITMQVIQHFHACMPLLGICLGHQAIGQFFGAKLVHAAQPVHGYVSPLLHNGHPMFKEIPQQAAVMRYHSLVLQQFEKTPLAVTAYTPQGEVMALAHQHLPLFGLQFHPESVLTQHGLQMLNNCLKLMSK